MSGTKSELPTRKKLQDARQRGEVSRSRDFPKSMVFLCFTIMSILGASVLGTDLATLLDLAGARANLPFQEALHSVSAGAASTLLLFSLVPALILFVVTVGAEVYETKGMLFSTKQITPDIAHLSPLKRIKHWFSLMNLVQLLNSIAKIAVLTVACYSLIKGNIGPLLLSAGDGLGPILNATMALLARLLIYSAVAFVVLASVDKWLQRMLFLRNQRMSKEEIKTERKQAEGDPHIKGHRRWLHRELLEGGGRSGVRNSSVVVTNPTRIAVALRYVMDETPLPVITAMGAGEMARSIRRQAAEFGIPIVQNVELARALWRDCLVEEFIPMTLAEEVAMVLASVDDVLARGPQ